MSDGLAAGIAATLAGALLYGTAPVLQARVAQRVGDGSGLGLRLTLRLARRPIWLAGLVADVGGFLLEAFAFSAAPATLVAPLFACDMVFFLVFARLLLGEPLSGTATAGIATTATGVAGLALAFAGHAELGRAATSAELVVIFVGAALAAGLAAVIGSRAAQRAEPTRAAVAYSLAAGVAFAVATLTTRQVGRTFDADAPWHLVGTATPYVLAASSVIAISLTQRGLQTSALLTFPIVSAMSAFVPVTIGAALLDDQVPTGATRILFVAGLLLVALGLVLLARARHAVDVR